MRVLIVEDDRPLARAMAIMLRAGGDEGAVASTGREALDALGGAEWDVVILDLGLPDMDGVHVLRALRGWSSVPVVVLSARHEADQKVRALDSGADDYVTKPFNVDELRARLRVVTRRAEGPVERRVVSTPGFTVDLARRIVIRDGAEVGVTPTEWRLLELLARNPDATVDRETLLDGLRGRSVPHQSHYIRVYMQQLRSKLEPVPSQPRFLVTVPGRGYRLDTGSTGSAPGDS